MMTIFHKTILSTALAALLAVPSFGKDDEALGWSLLQGSPVPSAMGYAGRASANDLSWGAASNPAKLLFSDSRGEGAAMFRSYAPDGVSSTDFGAAFGMRISSRFSVSASGFRQGQDKYEVINEYGDYTGETFTPSNLGLSVGLGVKIIDKLAVGVTGAFYKSEVAKGSSYNAVGLNALLMASLGSFKLTGGVANIGGSIKDEAGSSFSMPTSVTLGGDWATTLGKVHGVDVALDADYFFKGGASVAFGAQYDWKKMLFARAGYHFGSDKCLLPSFASVGAGVAFHGFGVDFSYLLGNDHLGKTIMVGLRYRF